MPFCWLVHQFLTTLKQPTHALGQVELHPQGREYPHPCQACSGALCNGLPNRLLQMVLFKIFKHDYCVCIMCGGMHICAEYVWRSGESLGSQASPPPLPWLLGFNSGLVSKRFPHWAAHWPSPLFLSPLAWALSEEPEAFHLLFVLRVPLPHLLFPPFSFSIPPSQNQSPGKKKGISSHERTTTAGKGVCARNTCMYMYDMP